MGLAEPYGPNLGATDTVQVKPAAVMGGTATSLADPNCRVETIGSTWVAPSGAGEAAALDRQARTRSGLPAAALTRLMGTGAPQDSIEFLWPFGSNAPKHRRWGPVIRTRDADPLGW